MRGPGLHCACIGLVLLTAMRVTADEVRAGVARVDLTPPPEFKASLGGYGARMSKPASGVHDRVLAKAIVLRDGDQRFALVTADILGFPPEFKAAVVRALAGAGWIGDQLLLLPSHSHTSIDISAICPKNILTIPQIGFFHKQLFERTVARLAQVVVDADKDPSVILAGTRSTSLSGWNRNRRARKGVHDPELIVTRVDRSDGRPLAVLVNWTAHPTFMEPEDMMFSGDFPGHLQRTLEALVGQGVTVMYYNGAQGDQAPVARADSGGNWEKAERYGRELGIQVWHEWEKIRPVAAPKLAYYTEDISLPLPACHPQLMQSGGAEYALTDAVTSFLMGAVFPRKTHSTTLRLGDLLIVGIPGEMTAELGISVKSRVRAATGISHVAIGGLADEWLGYILSAEEYRKGGYESSVSFYGETLGPVIVDGVVRGASRLVNPAGQ